MKETLNKLLKILEPNEFSLDENIIKNHCLDWRGIYKGKSNLIVFPKTVKKISNILKFCQKNNLPVVPQGGNTSLVGGSVPRNNKNEIIINLSKLNKVRKIDLVSNRIIVESGCILDTIKNKLLKYQLEFPLSMGSKGNCQIGGNISTNAGGVNVVKYGTIRQNILGIEAVLPDGTIFDSLKNVKKNNTGIDLKHLLIGSEGILGIITAALIQVYPLPKEKIVIWSSFEKFRDVINFYVFITRTFNNLITSFEFMNKESIEILEKNELKLDNLIKNQCYCLIEISNFQMIDDFNNFVSSKIISNEIKTDDLIISKSQSENNKLWSYRELIPLAEKKEDFIVAHDVSIPLNKIELFVKKTSSEVRKFHKNSKIINFGHLGDNNLHFNILVSNYSNKEKIFLKKGINRIVFDNVNKFDGAISAEHGIGQLRRNELKLHKKTEELNKMKSIKKLFDPNNILNAGKVI